MKINGNEIRPGNVIEHKGASLGRGQDAGREARQGPAYAQVELKNAIDGTKLNERFRSSETVERVRLEQKDYQFLYAEGDMLTFMDIDTYDQIQIRRASFLEERAAFLQDGMKVTVESHEGRPIGVALPDQVTLEVVEADPVVKGQTAASSYKPAKLENGVRILVPPFVGGRRARRGRHQRAHLRPPRRLAVLGVIPAKAGIQAITSEQAALDSGLRRT